MSHSSLLPWRTAKAVKTTFEHINALKESLATLRGCIRELGMGKIASKMGDKDKDKDERGLVKCLEGFESAMEIADDRWMDVCRMLV